MKTAGFTLLEVVIYLALFSLLMTGVLQTVYVVFEATKTNQAKIIVLAEGTFLLQKFDWVVSGATDVEVVSSTSVRIIRPDLGSSSPLLVSSSDGVWYLKRNNSVPLSLTNQELVVSDTEIMIVPGSAEVQPLLSIRYRLAGTLFLFQSMLSYE